MYYHDSIFTFLPVFTTLFALIQIVLYLIDSFALHRMAGNTGMKNPWIAWIPFAKDYLLVLWQTDTMIQSVKKRPVFISGSLY